ncbi:hypothetical protein A9D36_10785 [Bacillus subtilis]|nr:hypothetical protein A9D36_10785 [Bacillus subtilis]
MYKWLIIIVCSQSSTLAVHLEKRGKASIKNLAVIDLDEWPREILALSGGSSLDTERSAAQVEQLPFSDVGKICKGKRVICDGRLC